MQGATCSRPGAEPRASAALRVHAQPPCFPRPPHAGSLLTPLQGNSWGACPVLTVPELLARAWPTGHSRRGAGSLAEGQQAWVSAGNTPEARLGTELGSGPGLCSRGHPQRAQPPPRCRLWTSLTAAGEGGIPGPGRGQPPRSRPPLPAPMSPPRRAPGQPRPGQRLRTGLAVLPAPAPPGPGTSPDPGRHTRAQPLSAQPPPLGPQQPGGQGAGQPCLGGTKTEEMKVVKRCFRRLSGVGGCPGPHPMLMGGSASVR